MNDNFNDLQQVKRRFFAMRNGIVADALRKSGSPFKIIFGLNLPQLAEIATDYYGNRELAFLLWQNVSTRESMMLAPMLLDVSEVSFDKAMDMIADSTAPEIVDVLCHKLFKKTPFVWELALKCSDSERDITRYAAMRMLWGFVYSRPEEVLPIAKKELERGCRLTLLPAKQIVEEVEFMSGS